MNLYAGTFTSHFPSFTRDDRLLRYNPVANLLPNNELEFTSTSNPQYTTFLSMEDALVQGMFHLLNYKFNVSSLILSKNDIHITPGVNDYLRLERYLADLLVFSKPLGLIYLHKAIIDDSTPNSRVMKRTSFQVVSSEGFYLKALLSNKHIHIKKV